ncbi:MAG TPA: hypothetical protein VL003_03800 [Pusillimonas sp.]|nr:hypothetical protein [Pusillimonas sp.]HUH87156.1 hypothetical protein [Pusillimonas sp.]
MSKKPTQKKPPFVIEPLNWVAPEAKREQEQNRRDEEQPSGARNDDKN